MRAFYRPKGLLSASAYNARARVHAFRKVGHSKVFAFARRGCQDGPQRFWLGHRGALPMTRPFEGIRIIDITHVLAGPFAAYQLAVLGADVIKVEHPDEPDQSRETGTDRTLNRQNMGTSFLTQGSNKKSITLDLKTEAGRDILKKLVARADVLVENYRPGAFEALGLGYEALSKINPRLIYCSI